MMRWTKFERRGISEIHRWRLIENQTEKPGWLYMIFDADGYAAIRDIQNSSHLNDDEKTRLIVLFALRFNIYIGRDSSKFQRWRDHYNQPKTMFDNYLVNARENGEVHFVMYFQVPGKKNPKLYLFV